MKHLLTLAGFLAVSACAVPVVMPIPVPAPQPAPVVIDPPQSQSAKARFVRSVSSDGCALTSANTPAIMEDAVLSREDLARVMSELRAEGQGEIDGQAFRLTTGACA